MHANINSTLRIPRPTFCAFSIVIVVPGKCRVITRVVGTIVTDAPTVCPPIVTVDGGTKYVLVCVVVAGGSDAVTVAVLVLFLKTVLCGAVTVAVCLFIIPGGVIILLTVIVGNDIVEHVIKGVGQSGSGGGVMAAAAWLCVELTKPTDAIVNKNNSDTRSNLSLMSLL